LINLLIKSPLLLLNSIKKYMKVVNNEMTCV
jgi:hypothetical protein